ncbi:importin-11-like [Oscarella lobularis]|uniref:importin-11-like n=1 Tax=Oscarella lobularis TaxID=121494 RepID=UPI0033143975
MEREVVEVLSRAASQEPSVFKLAERQLKAWETHRGFYPSLFAAYTNCSLELNVRWQAILYLKNGIDRYWRKSAPHALSEDEKAALRSQLLLCLNEPIKQLATQVAVLIARIARQDCPHDWPALLPTLIGGVRSTDPAVQNGSLFAFKHVTSALASKRLAAGRKVFHQLTENVFDFMLTLWSHHCETVFGLVNGRTVEFSQLSISLENARMSLKVLRLLFVNGFEDFSNREGPQSFISQLIERTAPYLELRSQLRDTHDAKSLVEKTLILFTKVLLDGQSGNVTEFIPFLKQSLDYAAHFAFNEAFSGLLFERFLVNCLVLMKNILDCDHYRPPKDKNEAPPNPLVIQAFQVKLAYFNYSSLVDLCHRLVTRYLPLTQEELDDWDCNPEDFAIQETGEAWKYSLRPCVEALFVSLFSEFRLSLCSTLVDMIKQVEGEISPTDSQAVLIKEAVYNAAGLVCYDLSEDFDYNELFSNHLIRDLGNRNPSLKIVRRRIIWLMGQWVGVNMSIDLRPMLYKALVTCLDPNEDLVTRLTATMSLQDAVDEYEFRTEQFLPFLESTSALLFQLLHEVEECETKMHVLRSFSLLIERVGPEIRPYSDALIHYLPELWEKSADHNLLRTNIVCTLRYLVQALGVTSVQLYPLVLPIIQYGTDLDQPAHVYLLDDALDLWHVLLLFSPRLTPEILHLFGRMSLLLELGSERLRVCLRIITSYVLLGPSDFVQTYFDILLPHFVSLLRNVKDEGIVVLMQITDDLVCSLPDVVPSLFKPLLKNVLANLFGDVSRTSSATITNYLCLVGRLLLQNVTVFSELISELATGLHRESTLVLTTLLDLWLSRFESMVQLKHRKLTGLAMSSLLTSGISGVLEQFPAIIDVCNTALHSVHRCDESGRVYDALLVRTPDEDEDEDDESDGTEEYVRRVKLKAADPVHTIVLRDYFKTKMERLQSEIGQVQFDSLMQTIDTETTQQLNAFLNA